MTTFAQTRDFQSIAARPVIRRAHWNAWFNLFFGSAPLWWRVMFWAQRNKAV